MDPVGGGKRLLNDLTYVPMGNAFATARFQLDSMIVSKWQHQRIFYPFGVPAIAQGSAWRIESARLLERTEVFRYFSGKLRRVRIFTDVSLFGAHVGIFPSVPR